MMQYEKDFIYKIIPNLTKAVNKLTHELERYNDHACEVAVPDTEISFDKNLIVPVYYCNDDDIPNDVLQRYDLPHEIKAAYETVIMDFLYNISVIDNREELLKKKIDFTSSPHMNPSRLSDILISLGYCDEVHDSNGDDHWTYFRKDDSVSDTCERLPVVMYHNSESFTLVLTWTDYWEK